MYINGFWRSGTTWIMESAARLMRARAVFEPLQSGNDYFQECVLGDEYQQVQRIWYLAYMPILVEAESVPGHRLCELMRSAGRGLVATPVTVKGKRRLLEEFRTAVAVKTVRGHLCMPTITASLDLPLLHVTRDPRAVIASLMRPGGWGMRMFSFGVLKGLLGHYRERLSMNPLFYGLFPSMEVETQTQALACYWSLTEAATRRLLSHSGGRHEIVHYEDALEGQARYLARAITDLGVRVAVDPSTVDLRASSSTTVPERRGGSNLALSTGWQCVLSTRQQGDIVRIVETFRLQDALRSGAPAAHG